MAAAAGGPEEDVELQQLLESALDDFDQPKPAPQPTETADSPKHPTGPSTEPLFAAQDRFFHELFDTELAAQASEEFDRAMKELAEQEPQLVEQFYKLSTIAGKVGSDPTSQQEFSSCLQQTLTGLAKNATDLQNPEVSEEELSQAMDGLGLGDGASDGDTSFVPIIQTVMQNLLSKDVLYPSLKEITEKYPDWLAAHRDTLPREELSKYEQQHGIMGRICAHFEAEQAGDQEEGRQRARFDSILQLMQQLQELGEPPKELADVPPGLNFDLDGMNLSENTALGSEQCAVM